MLQKKYSYTSIKEPTNPVESGYLEMQSPSGEKSMIQVFYDKTTGNVYIPQNAYVRYQQWCKGQEGEC